MARYDAGETLASIARTYDCSPPAISYVVSRSRARHPGAVAEMQPKPPSAAEPQLIKAAGSEPSAPAAARIPANSATQADGHAAVRANDHGDADRPPPTAQPGSPPGQNLAREANGFNSGAERSATAHLAGPRPAVPETRPVAPPHSNGSDQRPKLHLSLGNGGTGNGLSQPPEPPAANRDQPVAPNQAAPAHPRDDAAPAASTATPAFSAIRPSFEEPVRRSQSDGQTRKEGGGSFIDKELRARVDGDIVAFLAAFDAALAEDTQESRSALREATDRLLRAGARTRIELERLEARIPLPPRNAGDGEPAWRQR